VPNLIPIRFEVKVKEPKAFLTTTRRTRTRTIWVAIWDQVSDPKKSIIRVYQTACQNSGTRFLRLNGITLSKTNMRLAETRVEPCIDYYAMWGARRARECIMHHDLSSSTDWNRTEGRRTPSYRLIDSRLVSTTGISNERRRRLKCVIQLNGSLQTYLFPNSLIGLIYL